MHTLIQHVQRGDQFEGVYYVQAAPQKLTTNGKKYTDFMLRDKSGGRNVKFWGVVDGLGVGDFVFVSARVEDYLGNPSIVASNAEKVAAPDDLADYIAVFEGAEKYAERFDVLREMLKEKSANESDDVATPSQLVEEAFGNGTSFQRFVILPASLGAYYGRQGGLLASTVRVADTALGLAEHVDLSRRERLYLVAGALLYRLGGIDAYDFKDCMPAETTRGVLLGVGALTVQRISSVIRRAMASVTLEGEAVTRVLHAVVAANGMVAAATKDAMLLEHAVRVDFETSEAFDFIAADVNEAQDFTAYDPKTRRRYYRK